MCACLCVKKNGIHSMIAVNHTRSRHLIKIERSITQKKKNPGISLCQGIAVIGDIFMHWQAFFGCCRKQLRFQHATKGGGVGLAFTTVVRFGVLYCFLIWRDRNNHFWWCRTALDMLSSLFLRTLRLDNCITQHQKSLFFDFIALEFGILTIWRYFILCPLCFN